MHEITFEKIRNLWFELKDRWLSFYWRKTVVGSKIDGHILMYHHVTDLPVDEIPSCVRSIKEFVRGLEQESFSGYSFTSIQSFLATAKGKKGGKWSVVTFDDVPSSFMGNAFPYLKKLNIPFTLFITTDYLDNSDYLSKEQIIELDKDPLCTIGSHTVTHPMLRKSKDPYRELVESKQLLEHLLEHEIKYIAYPYGKHSSVSRKIKRMAAKAGYECAFSTIDSPITDCSIKNIFFLPRIII